MTEQDVRDIIKERKINYHSKEKTDTEERYQARRKMKNDKVNTWVTSLVTNTDNYERNYRNMKKARNGSKNHLYYLKIAELFNKEGQRLRGIKCLKIM
jgi:hypothetical protein